MTKKVLLVLLALGLILSLTACPGLLPGEETVEDPTPTATPTPVVEEPTPVVEEPTPGPAEIDVIGSWEYTQVVEVEGVQVTSTVVMTFEETTLTTMTTTDDENGPTGARYSYVISDNTLTMQLQEVYLPTSTTATMSLLYSMTGSELTFDLVGDDWNSVDLFISEMVELYMYSATMSGTTITEEEAYAQVFGESGIDPTEPMSTTISQGEDALIITDPSTGEAQAFTRVID